MALTRIHSFALAALSSLAALVLQSNAWAVNQTTGAGGAVTIIEGTADFESLSALSANPYSEGGMAFSRTNLTFDNNGCGFAGCLSNPGFAGFSGNYMYGLGTGYFEMAATGGNVFHGLEFTIGTGFPINLQNVTWQAFSSSTLIGSGTVYLSPGTVIGFGDMTGFDTLRYTNIEQGNSQFAPAFDSVRAQFSASAGPITPIPEPEIYAMMIAGLGLLGWAGRRKRNNVWRASNFER